MTSFGMFRPGTIVVGKVNDPHVLRLTHLKKTTNTFAFRFCIKIQKLNTYRRIFLQYVPCRKSAALSRRIYLSWTNENFLEQLN